MAGNDHSPTVRMLEQTRPTHRESGTHVGNDISVWECPGRHPEHRARNGGFKLVIRRATSRFSVCHFVRCFRPRFDRPNPESGTAKSPTVSTQFAAAPVCRRTVPSRTGVRTNPRTSHRANPPTSLLGNWMSQDMQAHPLERPNNPA